jgi:hypothetical protein
MASPQRSKIDIMQTKCKKIDISPMSMVTEKIINMMANLLTINKLNGGGGGVTLSFADNYRIFIHFFACSINHIGKFFVTILCFFSTGNRLQICNTAGVFVSLLKSDIYFLCKTNLGDERQVIFRCVPSPEIRK